MKTILATTGLAAVLLLPTGVVAKPDQSEKDAAKSQCRAERGKSKATREAFRANYDGFADCVRQAAADEEAENDEARMNAAKECKAERAEMGSEAFAEEYGTNENAKNAFGKCVSEKAAEKKAAMDAADAQQIAETKNAAKACAAERNEMGRDAFVEEYGTNQNGRNAFGRCVSRRAQGG
jgi:membrane protein involved in colicin uptake